MDSIIEITDNAIQELLKKKKAIHFKFIRLGITGGGCAGFEYHFDSCDNKSSDDILVDFGEIKFLINQESFPYIVGMTLDFQKEGLNEVFKFINPKEVSRCGCGVSIIFDESKIHAVSV